MIRQTILASIFLSGILLLTTCSDKPTIPEPSALELLEERLAQTPRLNREAEEMALWVSKALVAPEALYNEFKQGLSALRSEFGDSVPILKEMPFSPPRQPSLIKLTFDSVGKERVLYGNYNDWDSLNTIFRMTRMDTSRVLHYLFVYIRFEGLVNSDSLASYYRGLPGVKYVGRKCYICIGDYGNLFPHWTESGLRFLLRRAGGDCPSGCTENHFWYFAQNDQDWELVGDFEYYFSLPPPEWWWEGASDILCSFDDWTDLCR